MTHLNPENARIKRRYREFLEHAGGRDSKTIILAERAIARYEEFSRDASFKCFDLKSAIAFKEYLSGQDLAKATIVSSITALKKFLAWLSTQPGYRRAFRPGDIDYLTLPLKMTRAARAAANHDIPSIEMLRKVIAEMKHDTLIEKRDRALVALLAITAIRCGALITLKLKDFDERRSLIRQDPRTVDTKGGKRIDTYLLPMEGDFEAIFLAWVRHLRQELLFGPGDPLFPKTQIGQDNEQTFQPIGLSREHWATTQPVRRIVGDAFANAGLARYGPHKFRNMLIAEMYSRDLSIAEAKSWSQNLGHETAMTTLTSYGRISVEEQGRLIRG